MTTSSAHRVRAGFSLVELIVSVGIFTGLLLAFYSFYRNQAFSLLRQHVEVNTKESAEIGLDFMLREIRMAGARPVPETYPPGGCTTRPAITATPAAGCPGQNAVAGFPWITSASATAITFQYDYRGDTIPTYPTPPIPDGCPDDANELVTYNYDAANQRITRAVDGGAALTMVDNVPAGGFQLRYFSSTDTELVPAGTLTVAQITAIWSIQLTVRSQSPISHALVSGGINANETTKIYMRNPAC